MVRLFMGQVNAPFSCLKGHLFILFLIHLVYYNSNFVPLHLLLKAKCCLFVCLSRFQISFLVSKVSSLFEFPSYAERGLQTYFHSYSKMTYMICFSSVNYVLVVAISVHLAGVRIMTVAVRVVIIPFEFA